MSGENEVFEFFAKHLEGWEIYPQPQINGKKPDIAVFNPNVGLGIFEVKDWDLTSNDWPKYRDAIKQAQSYRDIFLSLFFPRHNQSMDIPVTVGLIFTRASTADVRRHFSDFLDGTPYTTISGKEALVEGNLAQIFPLAVKRNSTRPTDDAANDLRNWLVEPFHAWEQRQPLDEDSRQKQFVLNPGKIKLRRMKGSAGSGKSVTLVRRAAKVAAEGKDVLFVYFNNSLVNYLRDICDRTGDAHSSQIDWRTFHSYCGLLSKQLGCPEKFDELAKDRRWDDISSHLLAAMEGRPPNAKKYHAIYVDEGQDFNLSWWNLLRRCVREDGEMMIAFDTAQQIYPTTNWNTETLAGAGFTGRWIELDGSRRLPPRLLPLLRSFAERFHPIALASLPTESTTPDAPCALRWVQVNPASRVETCIAELMRIIQRDQFPVTRAVTDLTLLCDRKEDCLRAEAILARNGIKVTNVAHADKTKERSAKQNFTMRTPRVKISTFQSYKGWQSRLIVLSVSNVGGNERAAALYTALTRVKNHRDGSNLTVICSARRLQQLGASISDFEDRT